MNCSQIQENLIDVLYGEASSSLDKTIKGHLAGCPSCRQSMNQLVETRNIFNKLPENEPPLRLKENILALARYARPAYIPPARSRLWSFVVAFGLRPAPFMVAAVMLLAVIFIFNAVRSPFPSSPVASSYSLPSRGLFVADEAALRERVLVNPFEIENPTFDLKYRVPKGSEGTSFSGFQPLPLEDEDSSATIETLLQQRRKMLLEADADSLMMRGRRLKSMGRIDIALKDFETIYHFYPDYTYIGDVLMYRAQCYAFLGEYNKALESLTVYLKKYPDKAPLIQSMMEQIKTASRSEKPALQ